MIFRPWSILVLAFFHIVAPIFNLFLSAMLSGLTVATYLETFQSPLDIMSFFVLLPIAGIAIYLCRWWSFPVFIFAMGWSFFTSFQSRQLSPDSMPIWTLVLVYAFNLLIVAYFLIPSVRLVYVNERIRWWEVKPRYFIPIPIKIRSGSTEENAVIENISVRGVLVHSGLNFHDGDTFEGDFEHEGHRVQVKAEIVYARPGTGTSQTDYGVQFLEFRDHTQKNLTALISLLEAKGVTRRPERINKVQDFTKWLKQVLRTGRGFVPQVSPEMKQHLDRNKKQK